MKRLSGWIVTVLAGLALWVTPALGQQPSPGMPPAEPPNQALPMSVALVFTLVIMLIVCMPSRKG